MVKYTEKAIAKKTKGLRTDKGPRGNEEFHGRITKRGLSLFPVWFLSYRSGNRIAYSVVNGQTSVYDPPSSNDSSGDGGGGGSGGDSGAGGGHSF